MVLYEVTARPEARIRNAFETYMREKHIHDVLASGCFVAARFTSTAEGIYRATYFAESQEHLDRYLRDHANALRSDFSTHFPDGIQLSREVWTVLRDWER